MHWLYNSCTFSFSSGLLFFSSCALQSSSIVPLGEWGFKVGLSWPDSSIALYCFKTSPMISRPLGYTSSLPCHTTLFLFCQYHCDFTKVLSFVDWCLILKNWTLMVVGEMGKASVCDKSFYVAWQILKTLFHPQLHDGRCGWPRILHRSG